MEVRKNPEKNPEKRKNNAKNVKNPNINPKHPIKSQKSITYEEDNNRLLFVSWESICVEILFCIMSTALM